MENQYWYRLLLLEHLFFSAYFSLNLLYFLGELLAIASELLFAIRLEFQVQVLGFEIADQAIPEVFDRI